MIVLIREKLFKNIMQITEIRSQNIKILYQPTTYQLKVGDFVRFTENDISIIAQIYKITTSLVAENSNQADLNAILTCHYNKYQKWNGETLSQTAQITIEDKAAINNFINKNRTEKLFSIGKYTNTENHLPQLDINNFKTPAFIGFDKISNNNKLLENIAIELQQHNKKLLIFDFKGDFQIPNAQKIVAGFDAKLPLDSTLLENLCAKILDGVSLESRIVIEDILLEIAEFAKESKNGFISITQLINVIDDFHKKSKISQLMLLKNKLKKYQKLKIFADTKEEVYAVFDAIKQNATTIFDISNIPLDWHKDFFNKIVELNNKIKANFYLHATLDEQNSDNKIINNLLFKASSSGIKPILSANYRYLSFENIFDFSQNTFLFKTYNSFKKHPILSDMLQALPNDSFIVSGKLTDELLLCLNFYTKETTFVEENIGQEQPNFLQNKIQEEIPTNNTNNFVEYEIEEEIPASATIDMDALNTALQIEPSINLAMPKEILPIQPEITQPKDEIVEEISANEQIIEEPTIEETPIELLEEEEITEVEEIEEQIIEPIEIAEETQPQQSILQKEPVANILEETKPIEEEPISEPIIDDMDMNFDNIDTNNDIEDIDNIEDIDVLDLLEEDNNQNEIETVEDISANNIEDMDLDELDYLSENIDTFDSTINQNVNDDELLDLLDTDIEEFEEQTSEPIQNDTQSNKIPIYNADYETKEQTISSNFQEGDLVKHQKYGIGTIKKITAHGNKVLCHINFDDFGRRLLDPEISQIEKM